MVFHMQFRRPSTLVRGASHQFSEGSGSHGWRNSISAWQPPMAALMVAHLFEKYCNFARYQQKPSNVCKIGVVVFNDHIIHHRQNHPALPLVGPLPRPKAFTSFTAKAKHETHFRICLEFYCKYPWWFQSTPQGWHRTWHLLSFVHFKARRVTFRPRARCLPYDIQYTSNRASTSQMWHQPIVDFFFGAQRKFIWNTISLMDLPSFLTNNEAIHRPFCIETESANNSRFFLRASALFAPQTLLQWSNRFPKFLFQYRRKVIPLGWNSRKLRLIFTALERLNGMFFSPLEIKKLFWLDALNASAIFQ